MFDSKKCIFCSIVTGEKEAYTVYEDDQVKSFLDIEPFNEGHILTIPKVHYLDIDTIPDDLLAHMMLINKRLTRVLKDLYGPDGYTMVQNGGYFDVIGHYHLHLYPRYKSDRGGNWTSRITVGKKQLEASAAKIHERMLVLMAED